MSCCPFFVTYKQFCDFLFCPPYSSELMSCTKKCSTFCFPNPSLQKSHHKLFPSFFLSFFFSCPKKNTTLLVKKIVIIFLLVYIIEIVYRVQSKKLKVPDMRRIPFFLPALLLKTTFSFWKKITSCHHHQIFFHNSQ